MRKPEHSRRSALILVGTIALGAYLAYQPPPLLVFVLLCVAMFCVLIWAFSEWPMNPKLSPVEKFGHWAFLVVGALLVVSLYGYIFAPRFVFVSPERVVFDRTQETYVLTANNIGKKDTYSVLVITRFPNSSSPDDFRLEIPQSSIRALEVQSADPDLSFADVEGVGGTDKDGNRFWIIAFARLHPSDVREIKITSTTAKDIIAKSEIMSYDAEPSPIQKRGDIVLIPFRFTEQLTFDTSLACFKRTDESQTSCEARRMAQPGTIPGEGTYLLALKSWKGSTTSGSMPQRLPD